MNPFKPETKKHKATANHLELIECISDYLKELPKSSSQEIKEIRKPILDMIEGHGDIHKDICKGKL